MPKRALAATLTSLFAAIVLSFAAHAQQATADGNSLGPQGLSDEDAAGIKRLIEAWTEDLHFGDFSGWEKYWTKDGVLAAPGHERVVGQAEIAAYAKENFKGRMAFSFSEWSFAGREDLAVVGNTLVWNAEGMSGVDSERYNQLIVLRKDEAGDWRVQSALFNTPR